MTIKVAKQGVPRGKTGCPYGGITNKLANKLRPPDASNADIVYHAFYGMTIKVAKQGALVARRNSTYHAGTKNVKLSFVPLKPLVAEQQTLLPAP